MDKRDALEQLPRTYGLILRLDDLGADRPLIADCLDVEVETIGPMLEIAHGKLAALLAPPAVSAPPRHVDATGQGD